METRRVSKDASFSEQKKETRRVSKGRSEANDVIFE